MVYRVGVISDTHGLLRPEALEALAGSDLILHAGDIVDAEILDCLATIAPLHAVRGNCDYGDWAFELPVTDLVEIAGVSFFVLHDLADLDLEPAAAGIEVVVFGHSHQPTAEHRRGGVLFLNPGSAGPRRFTLPVTVARVTIEDGEIQHEFCDLLPTPSSG